MASWYRWFRLAMTVLSAIELALSIAMILWPGLLA
jgi:hypothetical protein